ncbi:hypothetical protein GCM10020001_044020 [Nonomuraea salmonea]
MPDGEVGEVHVGGRRLARGYLDDPALTAARFLPDPFSGEPGARMYRTGDLGRFDAEGELVLVGRVDRQVKIRGVTVNLDEVEAVVAAHAGEAAVVTAGDEPRIVAYLADVAGSGVTALHRALAARLPRTHIPAEFVLLDRLPRTVTGKVDRAALPAPRRSSSPADAPQEHGDLAALWRELLERDRVGIDDDFFELGGHSLLAARMVMEIQERHGVKVDLTAFYERPTIRALSGLLAAADQPDNVLVRVSGPERPLVRLVCFPYAGGGVNAYSTWGELLPPHVELVCAQPPGRGPRLTERPLEWVAELVAGLGPRLAADPHPRTFLFGHSLGAIVAFEVARWLRRNGHPEPAGLLVAGSASPRRRSRRASTCCPTTTCSRTSARWAAPTGAWSTTNGSAPCCCRPCAPTSPCTRPTVTRRTNPWTAPSPRSRAATTTTRRSRTCWAGGNRPAARSGWRCWTAATSSSRRSGSACWR